MAKLLTTLAPQSALTATSASWNGLSISEQHEGELCSLACNADQLPALDTAFQNQFGMNLPAPGKIATYRDGHIFWTAPNQWFVATKTTDLYAETRLKERLGETAMTTLQTDAWAQIDITGLRIVELVERLVALDLSNEAFPTGSAARTQAHHINLFVLRLPNTEKTYRLLCARSYAQSLFDTLHKTATSLFGPTND